MKCVHYQVTFDPKAPRACKLFNFKGITMPYIMVKQATGKDCTHFEVRSKKEDEKTDLNDPKNWGE